MISEFLAQAKNLTQVVLSTDDVSSGLAPFEAGVACAEGLILHGRMNEAAALVDTILPKVPVDAARLKLRLELKALRAYFIAGRDHECHERSSRLLSTFSSITADVELEHAQLRIYLASALWRMNRVDEAIVKLEAIANELRAKPDSIALAQCLNSLASAYIAKGDWELTRRAAVEALVSSRRVGSAMHEGSAQANICIAERGRCRFVAAEEAGHEALAAHQRAGAKTNAAHSRRSLAIAMLKRGRVADASNLVSLSLSSDAEYLHGFQLWFTKLVLAWAKLHLGDILGAGEQLQMRFYDHGEISESRPELLRLEYLGDLELEQGHYEAALARYDEVLPHALALIPRGDVVAEVRRRRAECLLHLSRAQEALEEAKLALELCLELGDRYEEAATYRTLALAEAALGRRDDAKKHFVHGFAMYDDIETPYEWGKHWMAYGDWLCGSHAGPYESLAGAREAYRAACEHFEHMGAQLKLTHARDRLVRLEQRMTNEGVLEPAAGEKPRPRRRPSLDSQTQQRVQWAFDTFGVVTRNRPLLELLEQVATVATSDIPVLVLGESGTGKELIARGVHALSGRTGSLVEVNCSAVPATMMEAEFFGSVHGSYTGSTRDRAGLFEDAHEGSIFLDEIGEMPVDLQAKLLRFLETGEVRRIGANSGRRVDARLIAATNREAARIQAGEGFRQDLYYRLAHAVFTLPPLRSRGDDSAILLDHFLDQFNTEARKRVQLSSAARQRLLGYTWPGNVRQLRALVQRLVVQTPDSTVVTPRDLPLGETVEAPRDYNEEQVKREKARIREALEQAHFIKTDAARTLRMSRTTLIGKMKRYGIED